MTVNTLMGLLGVRNPKQDEKLRGVDLAFDVRLAAARKQAQELSTKKRLAVAKHELADLAKALEAKQELEAGLASAEKQFQQLAAEGEHKQRAKRLAGAKKQAKVLSKRRERSS